MPYRSLHRFIFGLDNANIRDGCRDPLELKLIITGIVRQNVPPRKPALYFEPSMFWQAHDRAKFVGKQESSDDIQAPFDAWDLHGEVLVRSDSGNYSVTKPCTVPFPVGRKHALEMRPCKGNLEL